VTDSIQWRLWKRGTWICLVLVSAAFMLWQITQLITQYRNFDVLTDTQTINPVSLHFPEVTICNANMYSLSRQIATGIFEPTNEDELLQISTPLEDFVFETWFNGKLVNNSDVWHSTIVSGAGRCWTFKTDRKVRRPGFFGGLKVYMDLIQDDYENFTEYAGVFVWALQPGVPASLHRTGNGAKSGQETFLTLDYTEYLRERTAPWTRCTSAAPEYTQFQCRETCAFESIRERCRCRDLADSTDMSLRICARSGADGACVEELVEQEDELLADCGCDLPPCYEQDYRFSVVEVEPSLKSAAQYAKDFNVSQEYLRNNFVGLTVNYEKMQYKQLTESKGLSFSQLLGSIGGSMGFFLGISLVSIFELFGDLVGMRLIPRYFGHKNLYGLGAHYKND